MNSKKTNWLVLICSFLLLIVFFNIVKYTSDYMFTYGVQTGVEEGKATSYYGIKIVDVFYSNIKIIFVLQTMAVALPNIVAAAQNRKYKRLAICQFLIGVVGLLNLIGIFVGENFISNELLSTIIYIVVPIILIILQVVILIRQKEDSEETGIRKKVNIVFFYIFQLIITVVLLFAVIYSVVCTKINDISWKKRINDLNNKITSLENYQKNEVLIPVAKDGKYGFVNKTGKELVPCEYDIVSFFSFLDEAETYGVALAKEGDKFYIISQDNYKIEVNDKLLYRLYNMTYLKILKSNEETDYPNNSFTKINAFNFVFLCYMESNLYGTENTNVLFDYGMEYELENEDSKYYYENENFSMEIEKILENEDDEDEYHYNVTVKNKQNDKVKFNKDYVCIDKDYVENDNEYFSKKIYKLDAYSDGSIGFTNSEDNTIGWYDTNGIRYAIGVNFSEENSLYIRDIRDGKIILEETIGRGADATYPKRIIDKNGIVFFESEVLICLPDSFITLNENEKFVMMDMDLNVISDEYDMIASIGY